MERKTLYQLEKEKNEIKPIEFYHEEGTHRFVSPMDMLKMKIEDLVTDLETYPKKWNYWETGFIESMENYLRAVGLRRLSNFQINMVNQLWDKIK